METCRVIVVKRDWRNWCKVVCMVVVFVFMSILPSWAQCPGNGKPTTKTYFVGYVKAQRYNEYYLPSCDEITALYQELSPDIQKLQTGEHFRLSKEGEGSYEEVFSSSIAVRNKFMPVAVWIGSNELVVIFGNKGTCEDNTFKGISVQFPVMRKNGKWVIECEEENRIYEKFLLE